MDKISESSCAEQEYISRLYFDQSDYDLLRLVNEVYSQRFVRDYQELLAPYLHPHGIKEMAAPRALRIAYSVIQLLGSLESGQSRDRIKALCSLRDEVLYTSHGQLRINAARVLIEIMKNLVRSHGYFLRQLELARDFSVVAQGKPGQIRAQLEKYHLLEMPEEWSQVAFDEHVHDVNTIGRKSPTHLIMDAWIKGIRSLTVIHYNYVTRDAAAELLEAAAIMDIQVRIGIEFTVGFREKQVRLVWVPRGFSDPAGFLDFLQTPRIRDFMQQGQQVSERNKCYVLQLVHSFNRNHLPSLSRKLDIKLPQLKEDKFLESVGQGQVSILHLAKHIHEMLRQTLQTSSSEQDQAPPYLSDSSDYVAGLDIFDIVQEHLSAEQNPEVSETFKGQDLPELLRLSPAQLAGKLRTLHANSNIILNLCDLQVQDVVELLFDCQGLISHLEILNLKNQVLGHEFDQGRIIKLQSALNAGNVIKLKKYLSQLVQETEMQGDSGRYDKLLEILCEISTFQSFYQQRPLKGCIGTDSTGQSGRVYGMGLVLADSLPGRTQRKLRSKKNKSYSSVAVGVHSYIQDSFLPRAEPGLASSISGLLQRVPGLGWLGLQRKRQWIIEDYFPLSRQKSNIYTLGGAPGRSKTHNTDYAGKTARFASWLYLKTKLKISAKIGLGFLPAFLTFFLSQDWWLLAYCGALIWFAITGIRNIIQSILGCGGINRPSLVKWNNYVSWDRLADSLMFTGFSVPLLDYLLKTMLLDQGLGATVASDPLLVYAAISLVNGMYLASHNFFRGLPRAAVVGNIFRSVMAIPLALILNWCLGGILSLLGVAAVQLILQQWAAIISKLASDSVAGIIEGLADRAMYIRRRVLDYKSKFQQLFNTYDQLERMFPMDDVLSLLESTKELMQSVEYEKREMVDIIIVNALDLLYFWMYQPRARAVLKQLFRQMTRDERKVVLLSQHVLFREKQISRLLLDGLVGANFSRPLSFYLDYWRKYLEDLEQVANTYPPAQSQESSYSMLEDLYRPGQDCLSRPMSLP